MKDTNQRKAAKEFAEYWKDKGYEKGESQPFWIELLGNVLGVENPAHYINFEEQVRLDHTSFIDGHIHATHVLIEQKSADKDLRKPIKQSDGTLLSPFQQAQRYSAVLPYSQRPRWIVACNFKEFLIYDMEKPTGEPESMMLCDLEKEYYRLQFLVDKDDDNIKKEMEISIQAGNIVGVLYEELLKQYDTPEDEHTLKSLNMLCVRLVFCLYAEDAGIFGGHNKFHNYLKNTPVKYTRQALIELFRVLDTKPEERDHYMDKELADFPYVNGGLFADEHIEIPQLNERILNILLEKASEDFDWSGISPTIFGAVFESTLNPETRRSGGMHYTSLENIHKVIDPLFLDELRGELEEIKETKVGKARENKLEDFRDKLASLTFLDPACGSGNFLTETYISLRRLENEALRIATNQITLDTDIIKVSIGQFYGIEINDFAVTVAKTALWIAESQMLKETEDIVNQRLEFLPLKSYANIVEGNALRIDWNDVVPKEKLNYIMGNPPFVGQAMRTKEQSEDVLNIFGKGSPATKLDYVLCWYKKSLNLIKSSNIQVAFVSTNSICQGESVPAFWKDFVNEGVEIQFAHTSFRWSSEANEKATVHCVIVGFSAGIKNYDYPKYIFTDNRQVKANNINAYLIDAPNIWIESRTSKPQDDLPKMTKGSEPTDDGYLLLTVEEKNEIEKKYPILKKYIRPFMGAKEFLHGKVGAFSRYCFWFLHGNPSEYVNISEVNDRLRHIKEKRLQSTADRIRSRAEYPYLFTQIRQPDTEYLIIPRHTSSDRKYIPFGYMSHDVICGDANSMIPKATIYMFGVLTSNVHMAWMRTVCGRLGNGYRYSPSIYNNFPWPTPTDEQKAKIEKTAQAILDARALYPDCSLADLYDELTMPPELRKAHQENDRAVMQAYGFDIKTMTESSCVAELMKMYQELVKG